MTRSTKGARVKSTFVEWIEEVWSLHSKRELKTCDVRSKRPGTPQMKASKPEIAV